MPNLAQSHIAQSLHAAVWARDHHTPQKWVVLAGEAVEVLSPLGCDRDKVAELLNGGAHASPTASDLKLIMSPPIFLTLRRTQPHCRGNGSHVNAVFPLKRRFPDLMLVPVMGAAQRDCPIVPRLHAHSTFLGASDVSGFNATLALKVANGAHVAPDPL